jgi:Family of unknown function (DUF6335)
MRRRQISLQDIDERGSITSEVRENIDRSTSPLLAAGDLDARWQEAEAVGDETAGASNPTPDQEVVDEIGKAIGITYADEEELRIGGKEAERDQHRWELDPASSEDYKERSRYRPPEGADEVLHMGHRHRQPH